MENISDRLVQELEINSEAKLEDVICLQEWCSSKNLPLLKDFELLEFHHSCFYDIENTKKCIESYFKIRRSTPELFTKREINVQPLKDYCSKISQCTPIGATKDGYQIIACRLLNSSLHNYTLDFKLFTLVVEVLLHKVGIFPGIILLIDNTNSSIQQIMRANWSHIRAIIRYMQEGLPVRLHSIDLISSSIYAKVALAAIKPFTDAQILNKIVFYNPSDLSLLHKKIPIEFLPQEFGGLLPSCDAFNSDYIHTVTAMKNYFDEKEAFESEPIK